MVYYVTTPDTAGNISFHDPRFAPKAVGSRTLVSFRVEAGMLVMFPSWLTHMVSPTHGNARRISIPMNANFPRGNLEQDKWGPRLSREDAVGEHFDAWGPLSVGTAMLSSAADDDDARSLHSAIYGGGGAIDVGVHSDGRSPDGDRSIQYDGQSYEEYMANKLQGL
jgi:hypothetical protein